MCVHECVCMSVPSLVIPELGTVWAGGLSWTDRLGGGVLLLLKLIPGV